ncbi:MAG: hypothetical protein ABJM29_05450 [Rhizobiaceae bacterium]
MFTSQIKSVIVAGTIALGALSATSGAANAEVRGGIYIGGPGVSIGFGHGGYDHHDRWDRPRYHRNRCSPRKAVRKARRKGLRRAHVIRVGHRGVVVSGRKWGERVIMGFGRNHRCPVRFVRHR